MYDLIPLQQSHAADELEAEFKDLLIVLFQKYLFKDGFDCNVMGIPYLGSYELITKHLINGNIANFDITRIAEDDMRYLLLAWKYRNGKRGTHFLKTFIKCTWGNEFEIQQLWHHKETEYPLGLITEEEIEKTGLNKNDFFLTSRIRVNLTQREARDFPYGIAEMLKNTLPARLFISEIVKETSCEAGVSLLGDSTEYSVSKYDCTEEQKEEVTEFGVNVFGEGTTYSLAFFTADNS